MKMKTPITEQDHMKPPQFPTDDAATNREMLRRIYERERVETEISHLGSVFAMAAIGILGFSLIIYLVF